MRTFTKFLDYEILHTGNYRLTTAMIIGGIVAVLIIIFLLWIIKKILFHKSKAKTYNEGNLYSLYQIIKYFIWTIGIIIILEILGFKLHALMAGSAGLLVGVGLGLQSTFNDFIAGLILLFEGSIKVGDILEVDNHIVCMQSIGLRTSEAINRDNIRIIIPNSLITTNKVINWTHQSRKARFRIDIGVTYESDVDLVIKLLKESAGEYIDEAHRDSITVHFTDFGDSALNFRLFFFSSNIFRIEKEKSEIRKIISRKFNENNISIPYPQRDIHIKSTDFHKNTSEIYE